MVIKLRKRTDEEIKESDDYTRMVQESFALDQHNAYLKSKAKEEKPKKSKTDLKKLVKEVKATKMPETFIPEIKSMKEKLKEISDSIKKPSNKKTKGNLKKLFKEVKATKMPSSFSPEIESISGETKGDRLFNE